MRTRKQAQQGERLVQPVGQSGAGLGGAVEAPPAYEAAPGKSKMRVRRWWNFPWSGLRLMLGWGCGAGCAGVVKPGRPVLAKLHV